MTDKPSNYRSILDNGNEKKDNHNDCDCKECQLKEKYSEHFHAYGGLLSSTMRNNLFKINPKNDLPYEDTSRDWSNIAKSVKNGLIDIQLLCEIASSSQIEKMFGHTLDYPNQGKEVEVTEEDHNTLSTNLISAISSILGVSVNNDPKQHAKKEKLKEERRVIVKSKIIPLEEERRKINLKRLKFEEELQKYKDDEALIEKIKIKKTIIENKIKEIDSKIRTENEPIKILDSKIDENDPKLRLWQAKLAKLMVSECFNFLIENHFIQSPGYEDDLNNVNLKINWELSRHT